MDDNEVIFVTRGPKCFMYNGAGHNLKQYKSEEIRPRTLARVGGDMMVGVCKKKPSLKSWILGESKHKVQEDFTIPGHATALAVSSCGQYCFVGIGKDLYVWKLTPGCLLSVIQQHYQDLSCIRVSADDDMVITGGKDGHVNVWLLVDLVQASDTSERRKTQFSWTNHSNEVTDIYNTPQGSCGRLATVSLDTTCRLYELNTGSLLTTVCLDVALSAVTMDTLECFIFCGDIFGELHCINIYEGLQREIHANEPVNKKIKIHEQKIVNLEVNFDGSLLLTASEDCIKVFMLDSFSLMTRIDEENCCGGITNAMFVSIPLEALMDEKYIPISKIGRLRRNLEESREDKPLTCTRVSARPPKVKAHYMEDTSILSHYIPCKYVIMEKLAEQNERSFQKQPTVFLNKKPGLGKQKLKKGRYTKNVGLGFKTPREATEGNYIDKKCPFTGNISIRGRILRGVVMKMKMNRTIVIRRDYLHYIKKYNRFEKRHKNMSVHLSPCFRDVSIGDVVTVGENRPLSKTVRFNVLKVTKSAGSKKQFTKF